MKAWTSPGLISLRSGTEKTFSKIPLGLEFLIFDDEVQSDDQPDGES